MKNENASIYISPVEFTEDGKLFNSGKTLIVINWTDCVKRDLLFSSGFDFDPFFIYWSRKIPDSDVSSLIDFLNSKIEFSGVFTWDATKDKFRKIA